jgi:serine/threonine protein kinase
MQRFALEGYVVDELVGFGGTGEVWRAREVATGESVALKRLRSRGVMASERLRREAAVLATLAGPHVIGLRRMVIDEDEAVMVMDLAVGGSLAAILSVRGRIPAPEIVTVLAPMAAALAAAHSRDLVHGDIAPGNILFSAAGRPLLADFGVARVLGTTPELLEGTAHFLDPVVAGGQAATVASDVFALAAVGVTALTGESVWGSGSREEMVRRAAAGERSRLDDLVARVDAACPAAMVEVLESMLSLDPEDRPDARSAGQAILRSCPAAPVGLVTEPARTPPPMTHPVTNPLRPINPGPPGLARRRSVRVGPMRPGGGTEGAARRGRLGATGWAGASRPETPGVASGRALPAATARPSASAPPESGSPWWTGTPDDTTRRSWRRSPAGGDAKFDDNEFDDDDDDGSRWSPRRRSMVVGAAALLAVLGAIGLGVSLAHRDRGSTHALVGAPAVGALEATPSLDPPSRAPTATGKSAPTTGRDADAAGAGSQRTPPVVAAPPTPSRWTPVVARLDSLRASAFAKADPTLLSEVYAPGAAAYSADLETVRSLASRGLHAQGFVASVEHVAVESSTATTARLRVIDRLAAYSLVDGSGDVVGRGAARPTRAFTMQLTNLDGRWLVSAIDPP